MITNVSQSKQFNQGSLPSSVERPAASFLPATGQSLNENCLTDPADAQPAPGTNLTERGKNDNIRRISINQILASSTYQSR